MRGPETDARPIEWVGWIAWGEGCYLVVAPPRADTVRACSAIPEPATGT